jgi:DNA-binding MarR family transcriptional regulator
MSDRRLKPQSQDASALAAQLRILLGHVARRLRERDGFGDLTGSQKSVLLHLERDGPATVSALARAEGVRPQSMGATIAALEAAGVVIGAPDPSDGRQTIMSLTPAFVEKIKTGRALREDRLLKAIEANWSEKDRDDAVRAIELLERLFNA